jgi:nucleotide-binding universal stress UspA family protein
MKRILVPCDFSEPAINAYRFALDIAAKSKGTIDLLHVIELPVVHETLLMPVLTFEEQLLKELRGSADARFSKVVEEYKEENVKVQYRVEFGTVSRMILDYVAKHSIDLVVMGSQGASGIRELLVGSNAEKIVRRSPVPVIVLKNQFTGSVRNIVFPNNLVGGQEELITKVKTLQDFFDAQLHIVWINTPLNFTSDTLTHERLHAFAKRFLFKDYTIHVFNYTDEEKGILEFSKSIGADLIAIGTHGRTGISHLLNGSLAEDLVNHNKGLVWTYCSKQLSAEA